MKKYLRLFVFLTGAILFSCSGEDDEGGGEPIPILKGSLKVWSQIYDTGTITVDHIEINPDGWVAIYRQSTQRKELLGYAYVEAGTHEDVIVELENSPALEDGETLVAMLHQDVNGNKQFDWDGQTGIDSPLQEGFLETSKTFDVLIPGVSWITVEDQAIVDNAITVANVDLEKVNEELIAGETVWLVAHPESKSFGGPGDRIGRSEVLSIGEHHNLSVLLDDSAIIFTEEPMLLLLYNDEGQVGVFEEGIDKPIWDPEKNDFLMTSFLVVE